MPKTFTLKTMPDICPKCGSKEIEVNDSFFDDHEKNEYIMEIVCQVCDFSMYNVWKYSYTEYYEE